MRSHQELDRKVSQLDNAVNKICNMLSEVQETLTDHTSRLDQIEREHGAKLDEHGVSGLAGTACTAKPPGSGPDSQMPAPIVKTATGQYLVLEQTPQDNSLTVVYCRVSSADQKPDLERQVRRVAAAATAMGLTVAEVVTEIGSGLNGKRPMLARLLRDPSVSVIVVEHRDRLERFGLEHLAAALTATGRQIVVIDDDDLEDDLVQDMTEVLTSLCARLYGGARAAHRARVALDAARTAV